MLARLLALLVSAVSAVGVWLTWRLFVGTSTGQAIEEAALAGATYGQTRLVRLSEPVLDVVSRSFLVAGIAVAVIIALVRRRWALGVMAIVLVGGANLTTQLLKRGALDRPDLGGDVGHASLPSGHTTVAASLAAALLVVSPRWARPWIAVLGAAYAAATGIATLIGQWHRPSDVVAAVLVVLAWGGVVCAFGPASVADPAPRAVATPGTEPPNGEPPNGEPPNGEPPTTYPASGQHASAGFAAPTPAPRPVGTAPTAFVLLIGAVLAALPAGWGYVEAFRDVRAGVEIGGVATYVAGALAVVATCAAAFTVLLLIRQSTARPPNG